MSAPTREERDRLREVAQAATPEPWVMSSPHVVIAASHPGAVLGLLDALDEAEKRLRGQTDYSVALQRMVEALCRYLRGLGWEPGVFDAAPHHARLVTVAVEAHRAQDKLDAGEARAGAAAMRAVLAEIADAAAQVLADDCRWHHSGSGCNGECIWSHVHAALATTSGRDELERRQRAEARVHDVIEGVQRALDGGVR